MRRRTLLTVVAAPASLLLSASLAAQQPAAPRSNAADPDRMVQSSGLPAGWNGRTDRGQPLAGARFEAMGGGWHVTTGPAVILWRAADRAAGPFHTLATFTQTKAPAHPEGYGMIVAGAALDSANVSYTYLLVRGDGAYLIKRRSGTTVTTLVDWTVHAAVNKADSAGKATNKIEAIAQGGQLKFSINGTQVWAMAVPAAEAIGNIGLRVNHNLDVHVADFAVHNIGGTY